MHLLHVLRKHGPVSFHLDIQPGSPLDRQRMHCQTLRSHFLDFPEGVAHILQRFARKPGDNIHIDILKTFRSGQLEGPTDIRRCMSPADDLQCFLVHGLRVDGNPVHTMSLQHRQLLPVQTVRSPGFHRVFGNTLLSEELLYIIQQPIQFICRKGRRCSPADIKSGKPPSPVQLRDLLQLPPECGKIGFHPACHFIYRIGRKGAVKAPCGAEGNADIKGVIRLRIHPGKDFPFLQGNRRRQYCLFS